MKPNVISPTLQGHFVTQLYHKTAGGMSSLKTSSLAIQRFYKNQKPYTNTPQATITLKKHNLH